MCRPGKDYIQSFGPQTWHVAPELPHSTLIMLTATAYDTSLSDLMKRLLQLFIHTVIFRALNTIEPYL